MEPNLKYHKSGALSGLAVINAYTVIALIYCGVFSLLYYYVLSSNFLAVLHAAAFLAVTANYFILRKTGNYERIDIIMTIGTVVVVCMFASGGWDGTGFLWPFAFLPFIFYLAEPGKGIYWILALVAGCGIAALLQVTGVIPQPWSGIAILNFFACLIVFLSCNYFIKQKALNYKEVVDYTQSLLESSIDPFFTIGPDGRISDVNKATEKIMGLPFQQLKGSEFSSHFSEPAAAGAFCQQIVKDGKAVNFPLRIIRADTEPVELLFNAALYRDEKGRFRHIFAVGRDVTETRKLEMQLRKFNEELEEKVKNKTHQLVLKAKEIEQFTYFASHDLQEPLNTTMGFIGLLKQKFRDQSDKHTEQYFSYITLANERMKTLVRELLEYSRLGNKKIHQEVDCNAVLNDVLADLGATIEQHHAMIHFSELPVISAYPLELKLLFQNLISNAIKFRKPGVPPAITITATRERKHWTFSIADNGIGMEAIHLDKIFHLFKRLHNQSAYEGSGIGLAHCRKIVEMHGGNIWAESEPGQGSVFHFSIPFVLPE
ncbi:ATP-binding protein [Pseudobacter ginsenosidimutans]|uniref:histidine kinase n=1 Tax=Pseudobacter ginsenosidimutans TaxID=661488 RepID=A0A4Q7N465_9BACT|nr:ATP-binding protein [Pseudobacter ginsenosidimutans]QEC44318.1 PAS domain-containing protein [Pseudobacter ginsenosidimutans]RZS75778.1 PAS domain S-box-containing protein [Pseudobacter ginsenosidimutans]